MLRIRLIQFLINLNEKLFYYPKLRSFYKKLDFKSSPIILDVGSHKGESIDFFRRLWPNARLYGFEPNLSLFNKLIDKYNKTPEVAIANCAISDHDGVGVFHESVMSETSTLEYVNPESAHLKLKARILGVPEADLYKTTYEVNIRSIATIITENKIAKIDLLKIDTEGHEYKCLKGLFEGETACKVSYMQLEHQNYDLYTYQWREAEELLQSAGYIKIASIKHSFGDFYDVIYKLEAVG